MSNSSRSGISPSPRSRKPCSPSPEGNGIPASRLSLSLRGSGSRLALSLLAVIRLLQRGNIEFYHLHHRLHGALRTGAIGPSQQFHEPGWYDLPGHAIAILKPAAAYDLAAVSRQRVPETIDLGLI